MKDNKVFFRAESLPQDASPLLSPDSAIIKSPPENRRNISRKTLINQLNYVHFNDGTIQFKMKHKKYDNEISLEARPLPCTQNTLTCHWVQVPGLPQKLQSYQFNYFLLSDGLKLIRVDATVQESDQESIALELPDFSYELSSRKVRRHRCHSIDVEFIQNGAVFYGRLVDFSAQAFKIEIVAEPPQTFQWIQLDQSATIVFQRDNKCFFSGEVNIIRHTPEQRKRHYVLEPARKNSNRFRRKEFRSQRYTLNPSPNIISTHPLTQEVVTLPVHDISGSGFSVEEDNKYSVLLPGLIIPGLEIEIANRCSIKCLAQIINRRIEHVHEKEVAKCGIAILDMALRDQMKLSGILQRAGSQNAHVCNRVNTENLWKFFFEAGMIYPQKYDKLYNNKEELKKIYDKLYIEHPQIARHFVYQDRGVLYAHMSMLRYFSNTWLIQHHISSAAVHKGPGISVLRQICQHTNDFYQNHSAKLKYVVCHFRSNNRFPNRVFGKFTQKVGDSSISAVYPLAYIDYAKKKNPNNNLTSEITIEKAEYEDLLELKHSIGEEYGKLIFHAMDFEQELYNTDELALEYKKIGFNREKFLFSVKVFGQVKAVVLLLISDLGLNLSNLTRCIYFFVVDQHDFSDSYFYAVLNYIQSYYQDVQIPVLIFPVSYADSYNILYSKIYNFWIFDTNYLDTFLRFVQKIV